MKKTYMIIEKYKPGTTAEIYARFTAKGRMLPAGVEFVDSWIVEDLQTCYQIMTCDRLDQLDAWMSNWNDLVDFEVQRVISTEEAKQQSAT